MKHLLERGRYMLHFEFVVCSIINISLIALHFLFLTTFTLNFEGAILKYHPFYHLLKNSIDSMSLEKNSGDNSENISDNTSDPKVTASSNSDICQELKISASYISAKPKSLEEKEINSFLYEKNKESISNTIRERNREKKLRSQDLSCENNSLSIETSKTVAIIDKSSITTREPLSPIIQTQNTTPSKIAEASTSMLKIPYNQKIEQGIIQEVILFIQKEKSLT